MGDDGATAGARTATDERVDHARASLRLSAAAWGLVVVCRILLGVLPGSWVSGSARTAVPIVVLAFVTLAVMAIRRALKARGSGQPISRWAGIAAVVDGVGLAALLAAVLVIVFIVVTLARCGGTCITF